MMGLAVGNTQLTTGPVESYPFRLPLTWRDRLAFASAGVRLQRSVRARLRHAQPLPGETRRDARARVHGFEDDRTFGEMLGVLPPSVEQIFACAAHRATAELDELSAGCGVGLFALVWGGKGSLIARNLVGGTGRLPEALADRLGDRIRTGSPVRWIRNDGDRLLISYESAIGARTVSARHVVVACQAPFAADLVGEVAPGAAASLAELRYGAFLSVAVSTRETTSMPWDRIYAMATPGRTFDMFTNQANALRSGHGPRRPGGSLMLFAGGHGARDLIDRTDDAVVAAFLDDLSALFPESRGVVDHARVHRWPLGNAFASPGRRHLQAALEGPLGAGANVHLAGDYFAELGNLEAAAQTGAEAAARVDRQLSACTTPGPPHETEIR